MELMWSVNTPLRFVRVLYLNRSMMLAPDFGEFDRVLPGTRDALP
jgi:hypothetical protein